MERLTRNAVDVARENARLCQRGRIIYWIPEYEVYCDSDDTPENRARVGARNIARAVSWDGFVERESSRDK